MEAVDRIFEDHSKRIPEDSYRELVRMGIFERPDDEWLLSDEQQYDLEQY